MEAWSRERAPLGRAQLEARRRGRRLHLDEAIGQLPGRGADPAGPGHGGLLHLGRHLGGLRDRAVVQAGLAADGAQHHVAGVHPHPHLDARLVHRQRGVARAHRVVLEGQRRAEQGHDPVAADLVDGAAVPADHLDHPLEDRIDQLPGGLGVVAGEALEHVLEIGEEHRDLLALGRDRPGRRQDALGERSRRNDARLRAAVAVRSQAEPLELVPERGAGDPEPVRRRGDVAVAVPQRPLHPLSSEAVDRCPRGGVRSGSGRQVEVGGRDDLPLGQERHPIHQVRQLAHVAGPLVAGDGGPRIAGEPLGDERVIRAGAREECVRQLEDVVAALPQGRHREDQHGKPMVEVLSEPPLAHRVAKIAVRRRDDQDVDRAGPRAPQRPHLAGLEHGQQLGLQPLG